MSERKRRGRGEGSIYQRESDGRWVWAVTVGYDAVTGSPRRKVVYGATKEEAQKKGLKLMQAVAGGEPDGKMMLCHFLDFWLDGVVKPKVDAATYALHRQRMRDYLLPYLGHLQLGQMTEFTVKHWYEELEKAGHSADLRNMAGQLLRRALRLAVKRRLVKDNVAEALPLPRARVQEMRPLDEAEVRCFLGAAAHYRLHALYLLALDTGMRQGEIIALEWEDVDLAGGVVSVTKSARTGDKGGVRVKEVKTRSSRRRIRLTNRTVGALRAWKAKTPGRLVFPTQGKGPTYGKDRHLGKRSLLRSFRRVLRRAGLPDIRFHDLRHTHATLALLKTKNIKAVSARLGHADIRVTLNTYAHYLPLMEEELVTAMEEILAPGPAAEVAPDAATEEARTPEQTVCYIYATPGADEGNQGAVSHCLTEGLGEAV